MKTNRYVTQSAVAWAFCLDCATSPPGHVDVRQPHQYQLLQLKL